MNKKIKKFDYGKELFADPYYLPEKRYNNKDYLKFLKGVYQDIELNTPDEKRAFKQIYDYFKDPSNLISKDILESLRLLKHKFPKILDPLYDDLYDAYFSNITYYRGGSLTAEQLSGLLYEPPKVYQIQDQEHQLNKAILTKTKFVHEETGRKHFLSFSRNFKTAFNFAVSPFYNKRILKKFLKSNRVPVIIGISGDDKNLILNPDFSDAVSPFFEDESLYVSNKVKLKELYVVNAEYILNNYDNMDLSKNNDRENLRRVLGLEQ